MRCDLLGVAAIREQTEYLRFTRAERVREREHLEPVGGPADLQSDSDMDAGSGGTSGKPGTPAVMNTRMGRVTVDPCLIGEKFACDPTIYCPKVCLLSSQRARKPECLRPPCSSIDW